MKTFTFNTLKNKYGGQIQLVLGIDACQLERDYNEYSVKQPIASDKDYMWHLFNRMLIASAGDHFMQSSIYHGMAVFIAIYEGKNGNPYKRLSLEAEVLKAKEDYESSSLKLVLKIIADPDCEHAMSLVGESYTLDKDFELPLANNDCERDLCRCTTSCIAQRDENGRLVMKS